MVSACGPLKIDLVDNADNTLFLNGLYDVSAPCIQY